MSALVDWNMYKNQQDDETYLVVMMTCKVLINRVLRNIIRLLVSHRGKYNHGQIEDPPMVQWMQKFAI